MRILIGFSMRRASLSGLEGKSCASTAGSLKRAPSLLARSASICDRIIFTGCGPSFLVTGAGVSSTGAAVGSAVLVVLGDVSEGLREEGGNTYLGPAADGVVVVAAAELLPENENRFEPSFFLNTVFALDKSLLTPDLSSGPVFAGVLMIAIVE
jgi:hypothetical protein